ncbi:MAG: hypothetical protein IPK27_11445 [Rhodanobacteraceae bacterium]|nr:hypothetical protein [Rhodanobacteraceae bacterium]
MRRWLGLQRCCVHAAGWATARVRVDEHPAMGLRHPRPSTALRLRRSPARGRGWSDTGARVGWLA